MNVKKAIREDSVKKKQLDKKSHSRCYVDNKTTIKYLKKNIIKEKL